MSQLFISNSVALVSPDSVVNFFYKSDMNLIAPSVWVLSVNRANQVMGVTRVFDDTLVVGKDDCNLHICVHQPLKVFCTNFFVLRSFKYFNEFSEWDYLVMNRLTVATRALGMRMIDYMLISCDADSPNRHVSAHQTAMQNSKVRQALELY
jgi:hypothetical protein